MKKKYKKFLIPFVISLVLITLITLGIINFQLQAEFFDIFGLTVFGFLLGSGVWMLATKKETPDWVAILVIIIGILGLFVDGYLVIKFYGGVG